MDFAELFTEGVQQVLPAVHARGLSSYFDYDGPHVEASVADARIRCALHRVLRALTEIADQGVATFTAVAEHLVRDRYAITMYAAAIGRCAPDDAVSKVLSRLQLHDAMVRAPAVPDLVRKASGTCPITGAAVSFFSRRGEGLVLTWRTLKAVLSAEPGDPGLDAGGAAAWLVCPTLDGLSLVQGRLARLGWTVSEFPSLDAVQARLVTGESPMLLLVAESADSSLLPRLEEMAKRLPATWIVLTAYAGATVVKHRGHSAVDIRLLPLSPGELESFTRHVDHGTSTIDSRSSAPMPLYVRDQRRVLVVDDNVVNQLVARGLLEALGYEVDVASNGEHAIAHCRTTPPELVVMDINMPVLDGMQAATRLRDLQCCGLMPPFPIIAATTDHSSQCRQECLAAGMDGYVEKPLSFQSLQDEVLRVLPSRPVTDCRSLSH